MSKFIFMVDLLICLFIFIYRHKIGFKAWVLYERIPFKIQLFKNFKGRKSIYCIYKKFITFLESYKRGFAYKYRKVNGDDEELNYV